MDFLNPHSSTLTNEDTEAKAIKKFAQDHKTLSGRGPPCCSVLIPAAKRAHFHLTDATRAEHQPQATRLRAVR